MSNSFINSVISFIDDQEIRYSEGVMGVSNCTQTDLILNSPA